MASTAESASSSLVVLITSPQTRMHGPSRFLLISSWTRFRDLPLLHVSCPAGHVKLPQNPAVRHISAAHRSTCLWSHSPASSQPAVVQEAPSVSAHGAPAARKPLAGHVVVLPSQYSARSHSPCAGRHTTDAGSNASGGQLELDPLQFSATSQSLAAGRHTVVLGLNSSAGQVELVPVQCSATSQSPATGRHSTVAGAQSSTGQTVLVPVQVSSMSQSPAAARQTAPVFPAGCWQASLLPSHSSRLHGLPSSVQPVPAGSF